MLWNPSIPVHIVPEPPSFHPLQHGKQHGPGNEARLGLGLDEMETSVSSECLLDEVGTSVSSVCLLDEMGTSVSSECFVR